MNFLEISNLEKKFDKNQVFKDINLSVKDGELVVLLGPSGCGKSTLLNCIAGLLKFDSGDISMSGRSMKDVHPSQRDIAMVFQSYALYPNMTVKENITFGMKIRKIKKSEMEEKVREVSEILNITELLNRKPSQLSGGQQQRVAIGRALVRNPKLFLFDEPLSNLDAKLRVKMRTEIKRLHSKLKTTITYVTHDQIEAMSLADKIAVMNNGNIVQYGTPAEIYFKPENVFVAEFIGSPPMNIIPVQIAKEKKGLVAQINLGKKQVSLPLPKIFKLDSVIDQEVLMGIRPEHIHHDKSMEKKLKQWKIPIKVDFIEPNGADNILVLDLNGVEVNCRLHSDINLPKVGKVDNFFLDVSRILFYDPSTGNRI